ncbi:MAG: polysaccharide biosynthesis/export family protein [Kofleriaceae bacterium]|nr:polysaccharide biosynthesis/export family protein [Kofleriaceae bacterium]
MRTPARLISLVALMGLFTACGPKMPNYNYSKEPNPKESEYVIGVCDQLSINVWKNDQLSTSVVVRPDGTVTMPLVGDLTAKDKTPSELRKEIAKRLAEYVKLDSSEITVAVDQANSYQFTVSGEVTRAGIVRSPSYMTVAEAIAQAGGFTTFADRDNIILSRRNKKGKIRRIPIVYKFIEDGSHPEMNLVMISGDSLHVP